MAARMRDETWPSWAKMFFIVLAVTLIVTGIAQIVQARHGEWVLGLIAVVAGLMLFVGWTVRPRWMRDPS